MINFSTFKSWEFLALVLTNVGMWCATTGSTINPHWAVYFSAVSAGAYALARGFAKFNSDGKPFYATTEFYVTLLGAAAAIIGGLKGTVSPTLMTELLAFVTAATAIANGLRTPPEQAVGG